MSNKHKHYGMIVAKAENMDLVVFQTDDDLKEWHVLDRFPMWGESTNYFLCLPKHKKSCLHWLNGGESQLEYTHQSYPTWNSIDNDAKDWSTGHVFMDASLNIRIKPKKEKRWIAYSPDQKRLGVLSFDSEQEVRDYYIHEVDKPQFIEIEVEV